MTGLRKHAKFNCMITAILIVFILGYVLIALEHETNVNKTAVALVLGMVLWTMYIFADPHLIVAGEPDSFRNFISQNPDYAHLSLLEQVRKYITGLEIIDQLGNVAEILFYLLGAMTIVEVIDIHHGFSAITERIKTGSKKKLLWIVAVITFFMSAILDNMTSAIVMVMMMQKLLSEQRERWIFGSIIIIAANAGGAWTPIGDVTTIMLWINENISSGSIMKSIFLPSVVSLAIPVWLVSYSLKGKLAAPTNNTAAETGFTLSRRTSNRILIIGILCLLAVPVFKSVTNLPPFAGIMLTLGIFWIYMDLLYNRKHSIPADQQHRVPYVLSKVDFSTLLFFLGILMSVAVLETIGVLHDLSVFLNDKVHNIYVISMIIGFLSSVIDNVPLVAAAMDMYPITSTTAAAGMPDAQYMMNFVRDGDFWNLIAYCAGTGGSILIIGSAAGVVVMGLEKINFIWYMKRISGIAIAGFLAGIGVFYLQNM